MRLIRAMLLLSVFVGSRASAEGPREALVVGLSSYTVRDGLTMSGLPSPATDAERLGDRLKALGWKVTVLVSRPGASASEATKDRILETLRDMGKDPDGVVLFAFSGHGFRVENSDYLTAFDSRYEVSGTEPVLVKASMIDLDTDLGSVFRKMRARRRLMVVDACRDVPAIASKGLQGVDSRSLSQKSAEVVSLSEYGSVYSGVLFSCSPGERSYDDPKLNGGKGASVFTEGLLDALKNPSANLVPEAIGMQTAAFVKRWKEENGEAEISGGRKLRQVTLRPQWRPSPENDIELAFSLAPERGPAVFGGNIQPPVAASTLREEGLALMWKGDETGAKLKLQKAAEFKDARSMAWLGYIDRWPRSGLPRWLSSIEWYRKASALGDGVATYALAESYLSGNAVPKSESTAKSLFTKAYTQLLALEKQGDLEAMVVLARYLTERPEAPKNSEVRAFELLKRAAEAGKPLGMTNLGVAYEYGRGVGKDEAAAIAWYRKAADAGETWGMCRLGRMYQYGRGIAKDEKAAIEWYRRAISAGDPVGMFCLGYAYEYGQGVEKDPKQAAEWYTKAANAGHALAMSNLGFLYSRGAGVPKDDKVALSWYRKSADLGEPYGMNNVGSMYERGVGGVVKSREKAIEWYRKAAKAGNGKAKDNLKRLGVGEIASARVVEYRICASSGKRATQYCPNIVIRRLPQTVVPVPTCNVHPNVSKPAGRGPAGG